MEDFKDLTLKGNGCREKIAMDMLHFLMMKKIVWIQMRPVWLKPMPIS